LKSGKVSSDSFSLKLKEKKIGKRERDQIEKESSYEFIALNISTTTRIESDIVVALRAIAFPNISHPISGNTLAH
jgi:hypothetical protein